MDSTNKPYSAKIRLLLLSLALLAACLASTARANVAGQTVDQLARHYAGQPFEDFRDFVKELYFNQSGKFTQSQHNAMGEFVADGALTPNERELMFRLLGLYAQLKYGGDAIRTLGELVAIPTVAQDGVANHRNKNFIRFEKKIRTLAKQFGLAYRNIDQRVYEISVTGGDGALIGLHAHADVVPANQANWRLPDGKQLDPFKMTRIDGKLYGRGTQDDKNAIVVVLYAMRVFKEERIYLWNDVKLLIDTTEETSSSAIPYYLQRNAVPDYNIALDGSYPVVIAEKGFALIETKFPVRKGVSGELEFVSLSGGLAGNQIAARSEAMVLSDNPSATLNSLNLLAHRFSQQHGNNFQIVNSLVNDAVLVSLRGVSAHSSAPQSGVNPVPRMLMFIHAATQTLAVSRNHITDAAMYAADNWGMGYLGEQFGIAYRHDFMGPLTAAMTKVALDQQALSIVVNLRIPAGQPIDALEARTRKRIQQWQAQTGVALDLSWLAKEPMYRDPQGQWVNALLDIASETLALPRQFGSSAGGTSIHFLPNGVQFGLSMPNQKYTGHTANEHKTIDQFLIDLQIVTEMLVRLGQMNQLD